MRNFAQAPEGNRALLAKRAVPWPEPTSVDALRKAIERAPLTKSTPIERSLFPVPPVEKTAGPDAAQTPAAATDVDIDVAIPASRLLYDAARPIILELLLQPHGEKELAAALGIPVVLAKQWLAMLMVERGVEKAGQPARYRLSVAVTPLSNETPNPDE